MKLMFYKLIFVALMLPGYSAAEKSTYSVDVHSDLELICDISNFQMCEVYRVLERFELVDVYETSRVQDLNKSNGIFVNSVLTGGLLLPLYLARDYYTNENLVGSNLQIKSKRILEKQLVRSGAVVIYFNGEVVGNFDISLGHPHFDKKIPDYSGVLTLFFADSETGLIKEENFFRK